METELDKLDSLQRLLTASDVGNLACLIPPKTNPNRDEKAVSYCLHFFIHSFFFKKGCQVDKTPINTGDATSKRLTEVVRGCQG